MGELYIQIVRGSQKDPQLGKRSILDVQFRDASTLLFRLDIEDERLALSGFSGVLDCPGNFVGDPVWIRVRLDRWANGTSVSVSYRADDVFMSCGRFELSGQLRELWTNIHARTNSRKIQKVLTIQPTPPKKKDKQEESFQEETLQRELDALERRVLANTEALDGLSSILEEWSDTRDLDELQTAVAHTHSRMRFGFVALVILVLFSVVMVVRTQRRDRIHLL